MTSPTTPDNKAALSRRAFLGSVGSIAGAFALGGVAGGSGGYALGAEQEKASHSSPLAIEPFFGSHQSGIETSVQAHGVFLGFNLKPKSTMESARRLMKLLTDDAAHLTAGRPAAPDNDPTLATQPARLTITFGFGPGFFTKLGLDSKLPQGFGALPSYSIDKLEAQFSGGDVLVQIGSDDPLTLSHAARQMSRTAKSFATAQWSQRGFVRAAGYLKPGETPRNLMGQVDGTVNPVAGSKAFDAQVWSSQSGWFAGGTMMVLRRIAMDLDGWDKLDDHDKELSVGRRLDNGAPLTGKLEHDVPDLKAVDEVQLPVIPDYAHIRRAAATKPTEKFLRRPLSYDEGIHPDGSPNVGLLFAAYMANIEQQYLPVQDRLAQLDLMNKWTTPIGSAVFAIPPGCEPGGFIGEGLLS
ncbi:MAG: putative deferrochelatase/peroxidase EfeN precursor [Actinomycetota bacterium]